MEKKIEKRNKKNPLSIVIGVLVLVLVLGVLVLVSVLGVCVEAESVEAESVEIGGLKVEEYIKRCEKEMREGKELLPIMNGEVEEDKYIRVTETEYERILSRG